MVSSSDPDGRVAVKTLSQDDHKVYAVMIARERYKGPSDRAR